MTTDTTDLETDDLSLDADVASEPESPRAPAPDPVALGDLLARVQLAAARPEREEELRQRLALADRRRRTALRTTANLLGVPEDEDLRTVALDDAAPETPAIVAVRKALAWRGAARRGLVCVVGGERGTGKSAALAHAVIRCEASALFVAATTVGAQPLTASRCRPRAPRCLANHSASDGESTMSTDMPGIRLSPLSSTSGTWISPSRPSSSHTGYGIHRRASFLTVRSSHGCGAGSSPGDGGDIRTSFSGPTSTRRSEYRMTFTSTMALLPPPASAPNAEFDPPEQTPVIISRCGCAPVPRMAASTSSPDSGE